MNPDIWQTAPEPVTPEERIADLEAKTQGHEAAVVAAINATEAGMAFSKAEQTLIENTWTAAVQAIQSYVNYRVAGGLEPEEGDNRVHICRRALRNADKALRHRGQEMCDLRDAARGA